MYLAAASASLVKNPVRLRSMGMRRSLRVVTEEEGDEIYSGRKERKEREGRVGERRMEKI